MTIVSRNNYVVPSGFVPVGESMTEQVGFRSVKEQIEAFQMAGESLRRYRRGEQDETLSDIDLYNADDITDVIAMKEALEADVRARAEDNKKQQEKEQVSTSKSADLVEE